MTWLDLVKPNTARCALHFSLVKQTGTIKLMLYSGLIIDIHHFVGARSSFINSYLGYVTC
jgi:hypothetical protein